MDRRPKTRARRCQTGEANVRVSPLGDQEKLIEVLCFCLANNTLPPKWAREELYKACNADAKSWDDVFGVHPGKRSKRNLKEERAYREGERLREQGYKISDDSLFPALGKVLGVSSGTAKDHYYGHAKKHADMLAAIAAEVGTEKDIVLHRLSKIELLNSIIEHMIDDVKARIQLYKDFIAETASEKPTPKIRINKSED
jgi:hypothetical protein